MPAPRSFHSRRISGELLAGRRADPRAPRRAPPRRPARAAGAAPLDVLPLGVPLLTGAPRALEPAAVLVRLRSSSAGMPSHSASRPRARRAPARPAASRSARTGRGAAARPHRGPRAPGAPLRRARRPRARRGRPRGIGLGGRRAAAAAAAAAASRGVMRVLFVGGQRARPSRGRSPARASTRSCSSRARQSARARRDR